MDGDEVRAAAHVAPAASWPLKLPFLCARPGNVGIQIDAFRTRELFHRPRRSNFTARFLGLAFEDASMENHARVIERTSKRARIVADRLARLRARQQTIDDDSERRQRRRSEREAARQRSLWLHHQSLKRREQRQREEQAALAIQRCVRGILGRRERDARLLGHAIDDAAWTLQRATRAYLCYKRTKRHAQLELERAKERAMQAAAAVVQRQARKRLALASRKLKLCALEFSRCTADTLDASPTMTALCIAADSVETEQVVRAEDVAASPGIGREVSLDLLFSDLDSEPPSPSPLAHCGSAVPVHPQPPPRRSVSIKRVGGGFRATAFTPRTSPPPPTRPHRPTRRPAPADETEGRRLMRRPSVMRRRPSVQVPSNSSCVRQGHPRYESAQVSAFGLTVVTGGTSDCAARAVTSADEDDREAAVLEELVEVYAHSHVTD